METATIIFADGTEIEAEVNGNCLITAQRPNFPKDLSVVTVQGEDFEWVFYHAEVAEAAGLDGRFWFAFTEIPQGVRDLRQMQANIEYIAMMTDVELDEE